MAEKLENYRIQGLKTMMELKYFEVSLNNIIAKQIGKVFLISTFIIDL